eukprot:GHVU01216225.1.p1 GENE.GHVU01216225.1~~GHVU01216225.1.p1  ORF type:complete len:112 (-),score=0.57 GHVU01216225.1:518-853(-)
MLIGNICVQRRLHVYFPRSPTSPVVSAYNSDVRGISFRAAVTYENIFPSTSLMFQQFVNKHLPPGMFLLGLGFKPNKNMPAFRTAPHLEFVWKSLPRFRVYKSFGFARLFD